MGPRHLNPINDTPENMSSTTYQTQRSDINDTSRSALEKSTYPD